MQLTKDKNFYKTIINISIPITLQNLITVSVNMADTVMLGKLGEIQLSASFIFYANDSYVWFRWWG